MHFRFDESIPKVNFLVWYMISSLISKLVLSIKMSWKWRAVFSAVFRPSSISKVPKYEVIKCLWRFWTRMLTKYLLPLSIFPHDENIETQREVMKTRYMGLISYFFQFYHLLLRICITTLPKSKRKSHYPTIFVI